MIIGARAPLYLPLPLAAPKTASLRPPSVTLTFSKRQFVSYEFARNDAYEESIFPGRGCSTPLRRSVQTEFLVSSQLPRSPVCDE